MQELVWTEIFLAGGAHVDTVLPRPYAKLGYYRDAYVLAYPSLAVEGSLMRDRLRRVLANGKEVDKDIITGIDLDRKVRIEPAGDKDPASLLLEFEALFEARAISLWRHAEMPKDLYDGPRDYPPVFRLESSEDDIPFNLCVRCIVLRCGRWMLRPRKVLMS